MKNSRIYLDHAATTPVDPEVVKAMEPYFSEKFGNPSALYLEGRQANQAMERARESIVSVIQCSSDEIIFTGSGTESVNLGILGVAKTFNKPQHIITSKIEHHAVLDSCKELQRQGWKVTYLSVDRYGKVDLAELTQAIKNNTVLVSIMFANNEIGTIQPIKEIVNIVRKQNTKTVVHTDACQATGAISLNIKDLGVDLLTINGSKIYGPKGIGLLYKKNGVLLKPIIYGGGQEKGLRSGTESVSLIVGLAKALEIAEQKREAEIKRLIPLRDKLIQGIQGSINKVLLNGHPTDRLPNNVNMSILDIEGEAMLFFLDEKGVAASTGSACTSSSLDPSHVLLATGLPYEAAHGSLRLTLGRSTTEKDIDYVLGVLPGIVEKLREMSPVSIVI